MLRKRHRERLVGQIPVDTAQLVVIDPIHLDEEELAEGERYQAAVSVTLADGAGQAAENFVAISTTDDGVYPVYVSCDSDGRPTEICIPLT